MYTAELTTVYKDTKRPSTTQSSPVGFTIQSEMTSTQPRGKRQTNTEPVNSFFLSFLTTVNNITNGVSSRRDQICISKSDHMFRRTSDKRQNSRAFQGQKKRFQLRSLNQKSQSLVHFSSTQFTDVFATSWYV